MTIDYQAGAEACKLALQRLSGDELRDAQWDEHSFFTAALAYCEHQALISEAKGRLAALVAQRPNPREAIDETAPLQSRLQTRDPLETSISDAEIDLASLEIRLENIQTQAEAALRRWSLLCFSRCCEDGNCCHVREAIEVLPFVRKAESELKENSTNTTLLEKLEAHRQRLTDAVLDAMRASSYFVNLMAERAGELCREFIAVLLHTFGWAVDLVEEERRNPSRSRLA